MNSSVHQKIFKSFEEYTYINYELFCEKRILLHISHQFFYGIHLPENQLYYADQQEMGWKKNQENMENSKHILASLHVFFFSAVATETKTFVIKNDDM